MQNTMFRRTAPTTTTISFSSSSRIQNNDFNTPIKMDIPPLSRSSTIPSSTSPTQLIVREKLFSWSGDDFRIRNAVDGRPYQSGVYVKGKVFGFRDQMTIMNPTEPQRPIAVCLRKFEFIGQTFKIYTLEPLYVGQTPSDRKYNGIPLYTYAKVERIPFSRQQQVTFANQTTPTMTITRQGWFPKRRVVTYKGQTVSLMEGGTWLNSPFNTYRLTTLSGVDPLFIVCLTAICDEMDETDAKR